MMKSKSVYTSVMAVSSGIKTSR